MASKLEEQLVAAMAVRASREDQMRALLANIHRPGIRSLFVRRCITWMEAHEQCNELSRVMCDSVEAERGAA
jgi:hypothetical protein